MYNAACPARRCTHAHTHACALHSCAHAPCTRAHSIHTCARTPRSRGDVGRGSGPHRLQGAGRRRRRGSPEQKPPCPRDRGANQTLAVKLQCKQPMPLPCERARTACACYRRFRAERRSSGIDSPALSTALGTRLLLGCTSSASLVIFGVETLPINRLRIRPNPAVVLHQRGEQDLRLGDHHGFLTKLERVPRGVR